MKPRTLLALVLMVVLPLIMLTWLGLRSARQQQELAEGRFDQLLEARLHDLDRRMQQVLEATGAAALRMSSEIAGADTGQLRLRVLTEPRVDQLFMQYQDGGMVHPPVGLPMSRSEQAFLRRTRQIFEERLLLRPQGRDHAATQQILTTTAVSQAEESLSQRTISSAAPDGTPSWGWYAWYWDSGLHLLFWHLQSDGSVIGAEINRMRLLADILDALEEESGDRSAGTIELVDSRGRTLHRLGSAKNQGPVRAELALSPPLAAWKLRYFYAADAAAPAATLWWRGLGLLLGGLALVGFAVFVYRESTREIREASRRVTFVNQVSHELRTPLTNIRLYAELLESRLVDEDHKTRDHLGVIVAESHRLSRLIGNVLSFGRHQRGQLKLRPRRGAIDTTVAAAVDRFRPALAQKDVGINISLQSGAELLYDPDAVEQILGNLLNNVEKYAASGGVAEVSSRAQGDEVIIAVQDQGPGIPGSQSARVFEPFARLSNQLTEGVSGAGIGLALSRDLARLHGGDLRLVSSDSGARFELSLPINNPSEAP